MLKGIQLNTLSAFCGRLSSYSLYKLKTLCWRCHRLVFRQRTGVHCTKRPHAGWKLYPWIWHLLRTLKCKGMLSWKSRCYCAKPREAQRYLPAGGRSRIHYSRQGARQYRGPLQWSVSLGERRCERADAAKPASASFSATFFWKKGLGELNYFVFCAGRVSICLYKVVVCTLKDSL